MGLGNPNRTVVQVCRYFKLYVVKTNIFKLSTEIQSTVVSYVRIQGRQIDYVLLHTVFTVNQGSASTLELAR